MDLIEIIKENKKIVQSDICQLSRDVDLNDILSVVCAIVRIDRENVVGFIRKKRFIHARQLYCYFAMGTNKYSSTVTGERINKDHSTVLYGASKIKDYLYIKDPIICSYVKIITEILE